MKFDDLKKLHHKKYRAALGHYLVEGEHLVLELQQAYGQASGIVLYVTERYAEWPSPFAKHIITERQMAQLSDTKSPQGIIAVVPLPESAPVSSAPGEQAIYLWQVQDPGNLGTILRTLAWFGGFRCLLSPGSVDPYNPKVVRASMGAIFHLPLEQEVTLDALARRYGGVAYLDMQGQALTDGSFSGHACYLFGNEAQGVPREALQQLSASPYTIAGQGKIESLNLASAVNMCVYELQRGR